MQFERLTLQQFTPGLPVASGSGHTKAFVANKHPKKIAEKQKEELPPPPPTFNEAELQAAKDESYRSGFIDGEKKGLAVAESEMAQVDRQIHALMKPLSETMLSVFRHYDHFVLQQKQATAQLAGAIAKKIAGEALRESPLPNIEQVCIRCIEQMLGEAEMHIYVHPALADQLEEKLVKHFSRSHEPGNVLIHKDDGCDTRSCRIEWKHGGLHYDPASIMSAMDQLVAGIAGATAQMHEEITPTNILHDLPALAPSSASHADGTAHTPGESATDAEMSPHESFPNPDNPSKE